MAKTMTKVCSNCGDEFECSVFNPYFTKCPGCRKNPAKKMREKRIEAEHQVVCDYMRENPDARGQFAARPSRTGDHTYWIVEQGVYKHMYKGDTVYYWGRPIGEHYGMNLRSLIEEARRG